MTNKVSITPSREPCKAVWCTQRYRLLIGSGILVFMVASFITGYFWGVGSALEQISTQLDQEAFSDQISASLIPMQMSDDEREGQCQENTAEQDVELVRRNRTNKYVQSVPITHNLRGLVTNNLHIGLH